MSIAKMKNQQEMKDRFFKKFGVPFSGKTRNIKASEFFAFVESELHLRDKELGEELAKIKRWVFTAPFGGELVDGEIVLRKREDGKYLKASEFTRELKSLVKSQIKSVEDKVRGEMENVISKHNARILNEFQLKGKPALPFITYDERVCLIPAMEIATKETLKTISQNKEEER